MTSSDKISGVVAIVIIVMWVAVAFYKMYIPYDDEIKKNREERFKKGSIK